MMKKTMKLCTKCKILKLEEEFSRRSLYRNRLMCWCKKCHNEYSSARWKIHKLENKIPSHLDNARRNLLFGIKKCSKCGIKKILNKFYVNKKVADGRSSQCKKCSSIYKKKYLKNPEAKKLNDNNARRWWKAHPEEKRAKRNYFNKKRNDTLKGNLGNRMSKAINRVLINGKSGQHWESFVDYTVEELKKHLEKRFLPGMSWKNRNLWHIDHKIPIAVFNFEKPEDIDFKKCWALKNIRPLWAIENTKKGAKLNKPFQPSLRLALK